MKKIFILVFLLRAGLAFAQPSSPYLDSLKAFRSHYVDVHEVVKGNDKKYFQFFPIDSSYRVNAKFIRIENGPWFEMGTTGKGKQVYRKYGELVFTIMGKPLHLYAYQSQYFLGIKESKNYLFAPFTDSSSAEETYGAGRYLDLSILDIQNEEMVIDFNKAYNPYCAYSHDYECPVPPRENDLPIYINAGEKNFGKKPH